MAEASGSNSSINNGGLNAMYSDPEIGPRIATLLFGSLQETKKRVKELEVKCKELENLGKINAEQETSIQSISAELRNIKTRNSALEKDFGGMERKNQDIVHERDALARERDTLVREKEIFSRTKHELVRKLENNQQKMVKIEPSDPLMHASASTTAKHIPKAPRAYKLSPASTSQAAYSEIRDQLVRLNEENFSLKEELKTKDTELKETGHQLAEAKVSKAMITEKLNCAQAAHSSLKEKFDQLSDTLKELKQEKQKEKSDVRTAYTELSQALGQTAAKNTGVNGKLEQHPLSHVQDLEADSAELVKYQEPLLEKGKPEEHAALQAEAICPACRAKAELSKKIIQLEEQNTDLLIKNAKAEEEVQIIQTQNAKFRKDMEKLESEKASATEAVGRVMGELSAQNAQIKTLNGRNSELSADNESYKGDITLMRVEMSTLQEKIDRMEATSGKNTQDQSQQSLNEAIGEQVEIQRLKEELQHAIERYNESEHRAKLYQEKYRQCVIEREASMTDSNICNPCSTQDNMPSRCPTSTSKLRRRPESQIATGYTPTRPTDPFLTSTTSHPTIHPPIPAMGYKSAIPIQSSPSVAVPPSPSLRVQLSEIRQRIQYDVSSASSTHSAIVNTDVLNNVRSPSDPIGSPPPSRAIKMSMPVDPESVDGLRDMSQSPEFTVEEDLLQTVIKSVSDLPRCTQGANGVERRPVASRSDKLLERLEKAAPMYRWGASNIFFLPGRLLKAGSQHYVVIEPASQSIHDTGHCIRSRILDCIGQTRELFVTDDQWIYYAGTYKLFKIGRAPSAGFTFSDFRDITLQTLTALAKACMPKKYLKTFPCEQKIEDWIKAGAIKLECIGLQCVGFNLRLSTMLIEHYDEDIRKRKREEGDVGERRHGQRMRVEYNDRERSRPLARHTRSRSRSPPQIAYNGGYQVPIARSRDRPPTSRRAESSVITFFPDRETNSLLTRLEDGPRYSNHRL